MTSPITHCQKQPILIQTDLVEQINDAHYIMIINTTRKLHKICHAEDIIILTEWTYLLSLPPGCSFETASHRYSNETINEGPQTTFITRTRHTRRPSRRKIVTTSPLDKLQELHHQLIFNHYGKSTVRSHVYPLRPFTLSYSFAFVLWHSTKDDISRTPGSPKQPNQHLQDPRMTRKQFSRLKSQFSKLRMEELHKFQRPLSVTPDTRTEASSLG
ncbi:hypothetical protein JTB14_035494 [Gonioctena quinquepunctata]|nr:hypothetical protein JTB14_035494 [Gonioctena quinquepunctata]